MQSRAGYMSKNRVVEWILAGNLLNFGFTTVANPDTISKGAFKYLASADGLHIDWRLYAAIMLVTGFAWVIALVFNGDGMPWTARVRWACSCVAAIMLSYMALCVGYLTRDTGTFSLGVGSHLLWAGGALYSCLRAGIDAIPYDDASRPVAVVFSEYGDADAVSGSTGDSSSGPDITVRRGTYGVDNLRA